MNASTPLPRSACVNCLVPITWRADNRRGLWYHDATGGWKCADYTPKNPLQAAPPPEYTTAQDNARILVHAPPGSTFQLRLGEDVGVVADFVGDARWLLTYAVHCAGPRLSSLAALLCAQVLREDTLTVPVSVPHLGAIAEAVWAAAPLWTGDDASAEETLAHRVAEYWNRIYPGVGLPGLFYFLLFPVRPPAAQQPPITLRIAGVEAGITPVRENGVIKQYEVAVAGELIARVEQAEHMVWKTMSVYGKQMASAFDPLWMITDILGFWVENGGTLPGSLAGSGDEL